jgi:hypothetical protein
MGGRDGGDAVGEGFKEDHAESVINAGQDKGIAAAIEVGDVGDVSHELDVGGGAEELGEDGIGLEVGGGAEQEAGVGEREFFPGAEEVEVALAEGIASDDAEGEGAVGSGRLRRGERIVVGNADAAGEGGEEDFGLEWGGEGVGAVAGGEDEDVGGGVFLELAVAIPGGLGLDVGAGFFGFGADEGLLEVNVGAGAIEGEAGTAAAGRVGGGEGDGGPSVKEVVAVAAKAEAGGDGVVVEGDVVGVGGLGEGVAGELGEGFAPFGLEVDVDPGGEVAEFGGRGGGVEVYVVGGSAEGVGQEDGVHLAGSGEDDAH